MSLIEQMQKEYAEDEDQFWHWTPDYNIIESEIIDQGRWETLWQDIVSHKDFPNEYVRVVYSRGSTEMQDDTEINAEFAKVFPKSVTVTQFMVVED